MQGCEDSAQLIRRELECVLASPGFARNDRLSRFLRTAVEWKLAARTEELKESVIGVEVFGRAPGYDPKRDPVVRTEASRLRARLAEYYLDEGADRPLVIDLPKGGYAPEWRERTPSTPAPPPPNQLSPTASFGSLGAALFIIFALALVAVGWRWAETSRKPISIAVLPFRNLSERAAADSFSDGLTGEIIRNLSIIDGLAVRSQASSFAFKNKLANIRETGKELGADYVLEGAVLREGNQLRVQVQLARVGDMSYVWSEKYDRESADIFKIQDEISLGIVNSLRLKLGSRRRRYETSVEAYDLYLQAKAMQINAVFGNAGSIELFERAVEKDPLFAPAYAGIAIAYAERSEELRPNLSEVSDDLVKMRAAANKAVELDPLLAEAHEAQAMSSARDAKWQQSEFHFSRAIKLDPNDSNLRCHYGCNYFLPLGRTGEGLAQLRVAVQSDPLSSYIRFRLGFMLISAGRYEEAEAECKKMQSDLPWRSYCLGRALLFEGKTEKAVEELRKANDSGFLTYALMRAGRGAEAERMQTGFSPSSLANPFYWAATQNKAELFRSLSAASWAGPVQLGRHLTFPEFASIRGDKRLAEFRRSLGLPE